jgi:hypothetical protein
MNPKAIYTPRTLGIFLLQFMSLMPFALSLIFINAIVCALITLDASFKFEDVILVLIPLMIGFSLLYFPQKYRTKIIFNGDRKILIVIKKSTVLQQLDTNNVKSIISKTIKTIPGGKHILILEKVDNSIILFKENIPFGSSQWKSFSEKLSEITNLPLKKELWIEGDNGKLSLTSTQEHISNKKQGMSIFLVILIFPFFAAVGYTLFPNLKNLIFFGCISAAINLSISFYYVLNNKDKLGEWARNRFIMLLYILSLIIPFTIFYLFFVILIVGLQSVL